jgi:MoxR-like ATPase
MPSRYLGTPILRAENPDFRFRLGLLFTDLLLVDEINAAGNSRFLRRSQELLTEVALLMRVRMEFVKLPSPDRVAFLRSVLSMLERYSMETSR